MMEEVLAPGVSIKRMEGFRVACVPHSGPYQEIGVAFRRLLRLLHARHLRPDGPMMSIYFEEPTHESEHPRSEAAVPVLGDVRQDADLRVRDVPPGTVASLIHDAPYTHRLESYALLFDWVKENGYERCGPVREVYCHDLSDVAPWIFYAELHVPIRRKRR